MFCPNCGHELKNGEKHCPICGIPIEYVPETPVVPAPTQAPTQQIPPEPVKPQVFVEPINPDKVKKPDNRTEITVLVTIIAVLLLSAFVFIAVSSYDKDSSTSKKHFTSGTGSSAEYGKDSDNSGNAPVSNNVVQKEVENIIIQEEDGVFYNNQGLVNDSYKNSFKYAQFSRDYSACVFTDDKNDLYYLNSDLTAKKIDNVTDFGISPSGAYFFYFTNDYEFKLIDCQTMKPTALFLRNYAHDVVFSQNGEYVTFVRPDYSSEDVVYKICVYTVKGEEVSIDTIEDSYITEGLSNDGKTIILRSSDGTGTSFYLREGKISKIEKSEGYPEVVYNSNMDEAIIISDDGAFYFSAEAGKVTELCSGDDSLGIYLKHYYVPHISKILTENSFEGCVVCSNKSYYWIGEDMQLIPFENTDYFYGSYEVAGADGQYKYAYDDGQEIHIAVYNNGETDDKTVFNSSKRIWEMSTDDDVNNIWALTSGGEIYHITEEDSKSIYINPADKSYTVAYDSFSERVYFVAEDSKLAYADLNDNITETDRDCTAIYSYRSGGYRTEYYDTDKKTYRIIFDNYIERDW